MGTGRVYREPDGFGQYGVIDENDDGLLCHECGNRYAHLGLHTAKSHDLSAVDYRIKHGLRRSKGLVAAATRETTSQRQKQIHGERAASDDARSQQS